MNSEQQAGSRTQVLATYSGTRNTCCMVCTTKEYEFAQMLTCSSLFLCALVDSNCLPVPEELTREASRKS